MLIKNRDIEMADINQILEQRKGTHGNFSDHAQVTQDIKTTMQQSKNWPDLPACMKETLDMIAHKIGRVLCGDPFHQDHWDDMIGYTKLTADILSKDLSWVANKDAVGVIDEAKQLA